MKECVFPLAADEGVCLTGVCFREQNMNIFIFTMHIFSSFCWAIQSSTYPVLSTGIPRSGIHLVQREAKNLKVLAEIMIMSDLFGLYSFSNVVDRSHHSSLFFESIYI